MESEKRARVLAYLFARKDLGAAAGSFSPLLLSDLVKLLAQVFKGKGEPDMMDQILGQFDDLGL